MVFFAFAFDNDWMTLPIAFTALARAVVVAYS